jgi:nucleoside-diphosphate-sugar epimerase
MVLIIGCGYVGTYVGLALQSKHSVVVSARSESTLCNLRQIFPFVEHLDTSNLDELAEAVDQHEIIIITLAAKDINFYESTYLETAKNLKAILENNKSVKQILYTSSTSVYGEHEGRLVDESTPLLTSSFQGKILVDTEETLLSLNADKRKVVVFRLGEIYGPGREITSRILNYQDKPAPGDGGFPTNMIHVEDITRAMSYAIEHKLQGVFNLVDDEHMTRKELYHVLCMQANLPQVRWDPSLKTHHSSNKIVSNAKIKNAGFFFKFSKRALI